MPAFPAIYEDNHLLVVDKPAGIATMGTEADVPTMARQAAEYLKRKYHKPGNVFVGVVSRLDSLVSGVLIFARTSKAASRLSEQIRQQTVSKRYVALVAGRLPPSDAWHELVDHVAKNEAAHRMQIVPATHRDAQLARLRYRVLAVQPSQSLIEVDLITGRKHQIRLQLAEAGYPVLGDQKYGSRQKFGAGIALHCLSLKLAHPTKQNAMHFTAPAEGHWRNLPSEFMQSLEIVRRQADSAESN